MGEKKLSTYLLWTAILIAINLISSEFFFRWDLTQEQKYTLSGATRKALEELDGQVVVKAFFTEKLPPQYKKGAEDFRDLLIEYHTRSGGKVDYIFINPNESEEKEREAIQSGIQPLLINVREKDEIKQKKAYMGAVVEYGDQREVIPLILPESPMEYTLTTAIVKLTAKDKPAVALLRGYGEPPMSELAALRTALSVLNAPEEYSFRGKSEIPAKYKTAVWVGPSDSIDAVAFEALDKFLNDGGNLCIAVDVVEGDLQAVQGRAVSTNIRDWLKTKGVDVVPEFVVDANCGTIMVQQVQGFFTISSPVPFPYLVKVNTFEKDVITKGLEEVLFPFVAPIEITGDTSAYMVRPIVKSSKKSGRVAPPVYFDVQKKWTESDFDRGPQVLGVVIQPKDPRSGKIVLFSDAEFARGNQRVPPNADNISLIANAVDWLTDETGLMEIRTKGISSRPIKKLSEAKVQMYKWVNFALPIALVIVLGVLYAQYRKRLRKLRQRPDNYPI